MKMMMMCFPPSVPLDDDIDVSAYRLTSKSSKTPTRIIHQLYNSYPIDFADVQNDHVEEAL